MSEATPASALSPDSNATPACTCCRECVIALPARTITDEEATTQTRAVIDSIAQRFELPVCDVHVFFPGPQRVDVILLFRRTPTETEANAIDEDMRTLALQLHARGMALKVSVNSVPELEAAYQRARQPVLVQAVPVLESVSTSASVSSTVAPVESAGSAPSSVASSSGVQ